MPSTTTARLVLPGTISRGSVFFDRYTSRTLRHLSCVSALADRLSEGLTGVPGFPKSCDGGATNGGHGRLRRCGRRASGSSGDLVLEHVHGCADCSRRALLIMDIRRSVRRGSQRTTPQCPQNTQPNGKDPRHGAGFPADSVSQEDQHG